MLLAVTACAGSSRYTDTMFRAAIAKHSTSPDFVLVTVRDARSSSSQMVCVEAPSLEAALHVEYRMPYNELGARRIEELLFASPDRVYSFSKPAALAYVTPSYSREVLAKVRSILSSRSDAQLRSASLDSLYVGKPYRAYEALPRCCGSRFARAWHPMRARLRSQQSLC
jgi:hypothetical protein